MDKTQLLDRISKKEVQIEKINKRIIKWSKELTEEQISFVEESIDSLWSEYRTSIQEKFGKYNSNMDELRRAHQDLAEAKVILNKYKNQLELVESREGQEKIPVLVEFFKRYKKEVTRYIEFNMPTLVEYYRINSEYCDWHNHRNSIMREENLTEDEWKKKLYQLREREDELKSMVHPITFSVYDRRAEDNIDREKLDKILDKDIEAKYYNMVERVTKITGEIIDADHIDIGGDGNLNGVIKGTEGTAKLETIGAGGYNIQCYHYRLLVHPVR